MKKINVWLVLTSLLISFSCQTSSDLEMALTSNFDGKNALVEPASFDRTSDAVQKMALDVATMLRSSDELRSTKTLSVSSVYALKDERDMRSLSASNANLHVVEFANNEGYALVSGNNGNSEVLYVADNGKFDKDFYRENLAPFVQGYMIMYICPSCGFVGSCVLGKCYVPSLPPGVICPYRCRSIMDCIHNPRRDSIMRKFSQPVVFSPYKLIRSKDNLLKTNWDLWWPFNILTPMVEYKENGVDTVGHAAIGCNTVAIMQIMAYHQFPQLIDGDAIPWERFRNMDHFEGDDATIIAKAAKYIADEIKSTYGYANSKHTAAHSSDVKNFMLKVGFKNYDDQPYNIDAVMNELDQNRPIFITASQKGASAGHIWILDGYREIHYIEPSDTIIRNFVHCNWGWGKESNQGYCLSGMFSTERRYDERNIIVGFINSNPPKKAYTERCRIYTGIEPKK